MAMESKLRGRRHCHAHWLYVLFCFVTLFLPILATGAAKRTIITSSASLEVNSTTAWQGESVLMRCVAKPKYAGISKVLWMRREHDGTMRNIYLYNREHPKATGPYKQFIGRISGWLKVVEGTYYLNLTRTIMSDTAEYYCIVTDDNHLDMISPAKHLTVNVKHFNHFIRVKGSSESFSHCEEVTLDSSSEDEEVQITCSVTSAPKSRLLWSAISPHHKDWVLGLSVDNCTTDSTHLYTCTSISMLKMSALKSKKTQIRCEASFPTLTPTSDACVTLVYEIVSPSQNSVISSASLEMNSDTAWQGESVLMRCVAKPKYAGISKVLWMRREHDGTMEPVHVDNQEHPKATGPHQQFGGRMVGWLDVEKETYYLNMTRTLVSDTAEYYCVITDNNYADKTSPAKQLTVNVKHSNHSIRVNKSSESFSRCEEVTLDSSSEDEEVKITCSVTSAPKSRLKWSVASGNHKDWMHGPSVENCTAYSTHLYTCTSTTTLKLSALMSKRTQIHCEASFPTLMRTSDACVTLVYQKISPPTNAMPWIIVGVFWISVVVILVILFQRKQRPQENETHLPSPYQPM